MTQRVDKAIQGGRAAFFDNPESDRLLAMLMRFMTDHWALKERVLVLEKLLVEKKLLDADSVESFTPDAATDQDWDGQSFEFIRAVVEAAQNIKTGK